MKSQRFVLWTVCLLTMMVPAIMQSGDLVSGRVERSIGVAPRGQVSSIAYSYYASTPDMPAYQRAVNTFIAGSVGSLWQDQPDRSTSMLSREWFDTVLADVDSMCRVTRADIPEMAPWTLIDSIEISDQIVVNGRPTELVQVFRTRYQFTGGAHGLSTTLSTLFDRTTGQTVSLFTLLGSNKKKFSLLAERHFRTQQRIPRGTSLKKAGYWFEKGFQPTDNIQFEGDALVLIYNPYEIAPYVYGTIRVRLPIAEVLPLLSLPYAR